MRRIIPLPGRIRRALFMDDRGLPVVEFAIALPVLVALSVGAVEVGLYGMLNMKLQSTVSNLSNLTTRSATLSQDRLDDVFESVGASIAPFEVGPNSRFIVTSVSTDENGAATVDWQRGGGGSLNATSRIGSASDAANVPETLTTSGSTMVIVEGFYAHEDKLFGMVPSGEVYKVLYTRPRLGAIDEPE